MEIRSLGKLFGLLIIAGMAMGAPNLGAEMNLEAERASTVTEFELGTELSYIKYKEPGIMEQDGLMLGLAGNYTARLPQRLVLGLDGRIAFGQVDYESRNTGTIDDIFDFIFETRATVGMDFKVIDTTRLTPYVGLGYRFLSDQMGGEVSSTGHLGYDRYSNYFYLPIGISTMTPLDDEWHLGFNAEFDVFLRGYQYSQLGDAISGLDTLKNTQDEGYGVRGSIKLVKAAAAQDLFIEPYIRYWNIKDSDIKVVTAGGRSVGVAGLEPKNNSREIGVRVGVHF